MRIPSLPAKFNNEPPKEHLPLWSKAVSKSWAEKSGNVEYRIDRTEEHPGILTFKIPKGDLRAQDVSFYKISGTDDAYLADLSDFDDEGDGVVSSDLNEDEHGSSQSGVDNLYASQQ